VTAKQTPIDLGVTGVGAFAAGGAHTCAALGTTVTCWGRNDDGQLGDGTRTTRRTPGPVALSGDIARLTAGQSFSCALDVAGVVSCWGEGGKLGANTFTDQLTPVTTLDRVLDIDAGDLHACAIRDDHTVWCWGDCTRNRCGLDSSNAQQLVPKQVLGIANAVGISAGSSHTCVQLQGDTALCWGADSFGQLARGTTPALQPAPVCSAR
jgi:alpha-tubulin suppressor-like RCC1 family protein